MRILNKPTRSLVIGGLFFIIPLIIIIALGKEAIDILRPLGQTISHKLGVSTVFGKATISIICIVFLLFICYLAGLLLKIGMVSDWGDKIEEKIFLFLPQLQIIKYRLTGEDAMRKAYGRPYCSKMNSFMCSYSSRAALTKK